MASVLLTTSETDTGYLPAAYPVTVSATPTAVGLASGGVVPGSWNGTSFAELRSVPVGYSSYTRLYVVTPPTRNGPSFCNDDSRALVAGGSLVFICDHRRRVQRPGHHHVRPRAGTGRGDRHAA